MLNSKLQPRLMSDNYFRITIAISMIDKLTWRTYGLVVRAPGRFPGGAGSSTATLKFLYDF